MSHPFAPLARALADHAVRYLLIGISGANMYAPPGQPRFVTGDSVHRLEERDRNLLARRALTRITGPEDLKVDLTLVMKGFEFDEVWAERRTFAIDGIDVPTARLLHIVQSKAAAGRPKDQLFLATHQDALEQLLRPGPPLPRRPDEPND